LGHDFLEVGEEDADITVDVTVFADVDIIEDIMVCVDDIDVEVMVCVDDIIAFVVAGFCSKRII
jgi:hypothetical protein